MDHIDHVLASQSVDHNYDTPIRAALAMGKKTLNRYYMLTDSSEVYRIAMGIFSIQYSGFGIHRGVPVLHPRHKLSYFTKAGWEPAWLTTTHEIVRAEFDRSYPASLGDGENGGAALAVRTTKVRRCHFFLFLNC